VRNYFQDPPEVPESSIVRKSRKRETSIRIQNPPISKTKEVDQEEKLERTKDKKQKKLKGKKDIEDVYQSPEPSLEEDYQPLSERLTHLQGQSAAARKKEKEKQSIEEEGTSPQHLRRSTRLRGKCWKAQKKGPHLLTWEEEHRNNLQLAVAYLILSQTLKLVLQMLT